MLWKRSLFLSIIVILQKPNTANYRDNFVMVNFPDKYECTLKPALKTDFSRQTSRVHKTLLIVKHDLERSTAKKQLIH